MDGSARRRRTTDNVRIDHDARAVTARLNQQIPLLQDRAVFIRASFGSSHLDEDRLRSLRQDATALLAEVAGHLAELDKAESLADPHVRSSTRLMDTRRALRSVADCAAMVLPKGEE